MSNEKISDALGIEYIPENKSLVEANTSSKSVVVYNPEHELEDYEKVRDTLTELIKKGADGLDDIMSIASSSEKARDFEVAANFMKTIAEISKDLYALHEKVKKIRGAESGDLRDKPVTGPINVDKAVVFSGTTTQMLEQIKKLHGKDD